ncbi:unnamed protein product [Parnassius mnemosyne]|uniref:Uncharacterized protein n=1 Tax=Parnassius mnemosyne TaxID=213953 RepID=A0AAV1K7X3_9NEOP
MVSTAEEVCGTIKRGSSKRRDAWWNDEMKEAVRKKKKAWLDYLASSNDKDMREKMKVRYKLQKVHTKALIEEVRERCRMEADERLSHNFKEISKLFWKEVGRTRSGATALRMNKVLSRTNDALSEKSDVMQRWSEFYREMYAKYNMLTYLGSFLFSLTVFLLGSSLDVLFIMKYCCSFQDMFLK